MNNKRLLAIYLKDHQAGAAAGTRRFHRSAAHQTDPAVRDALTAITAEVAQDQQALSSMMSRLRIRPSRLKGLVFRAGEILGLAKLNGALLRRSPLTDLVELEALTLAVNGKRLGWQALRQIDLHALGVEPDELAALQERAESQRDRLEALRLGRVEALWPKG